MTSSTILCRCLGLRAYLIARSGHPRQSIMLEYALVDELADSARRYRDPWKVLNADEPYKEDTPGNVTWFLLLLLCCFCLSPNTDLPVGCTRKESRRLPSRPAVCTERQCARTSLHDRTDVQTRTYKRRRSYTVMCQATVISISDTK